VGDGGVVGAVAVDRDVRFFSVPERQFGVSVLRAAFSAPASTLDRVTIDGAEASAMTRDEIVRSAFTAFRADVPRLIDCALRRPDDPAMAVEALIRSLRPPDRYPPRLGR
jgi:hypothetical protein